MKAESCREWRESLGAYALDSLPAEERAGLEAHLEGCADMPRGARSLPRSPPCCPLADPARFESPPALPAALAGRVVAAIGPERRVRRRRRASGFGLALGTAVAAAAACWRSSSCPAAASPRPSST